MGGGLTASAILMRTDGEWTEDSLSEERLQPPNVKLFDQPGNRDASDYWALEVEESETRPHSQGLFR